MLNAQCVTQLNERKEEEKIKRLQEENENLGETVVKYCEKYEKERNRVHYFKNKYSDRETTDEESRNIKENIAYYENLMSKLQEKIVSFDNNLVQTFMNGR